LSEIVRKVDRRLSAVRKSRGEKVETVVLVPFEQAMYSADRTSLGEITAERGVAAELWSGDTMRFVVYMIGFLILIGGLSWAAITAGAPQLYVLIGAVILLGLGIVTGVSRTTYRSGRGVTVVRDNDRV
jgi:uncharacterized membrane protein YedE/YeeE